MPPHRAYLVFAGLEQAIGDLLTLAFSAEQIEGIRRFPAFAHADTAFFTMLGSLRFEGDVWAVPEGTIVFPGETLLRVTAPLPQAQWVETFLLASLSYPTLVASKAARAVTRRGAARCLTLGRVAATGRTWVARGPRSLPRRFRRHQSRRGGPAAGHPRFGDDGSFVGSVVRLRSGGFRRLRPCFPGHDDTAHRHLRHARRCAQGRRHRSSGAGGPD